MVHAILVLMCAVPPVQDDEYVKFDLPARELESDGPRWSAGFGVDIYTGFGSVFNDVVGASFRLGHRFNDRWGVALTVFRTDFDFEDPADNLFGRSGTPVSDASIDMTMVSATARWYFTGPGAALDFYVGAGLGLAFPGSGEAVNLPQVDIAVDGNAGAEVHVVVGGAARLFSQLYFAVELRLMQSFTEYDVEDRISGETESEDGWAGYGIGLGLEWRF
jgi:hypothetical protein